MKNDIETTSLLDIREFLRTHDGGAAPWESPQRVVERLYEALRSRRGDDRFWGDLLRLVRRLEDHRFDEKAMRGSRALGDATLDSLIEDLRRSLDGTERQSGIGKWISASLTGSALLGFLVLGYSAGCLNGNGNDNDSGSDDDTAGPSADDADDADDDDSQPTDDTTAFCQEADDQGYTGETADVFCGLIEIIEEADIAEGIKSDIIDCLPGLGAVYRETLLEQFQTMDDEALASYLEDMVNPGGVCYEDPWGDDTWGDDH